MAEVKLPLFKLTMAPSDEETGVDLISLVKQPAIETNWVMLNTAQVRLMAQGERQWLTGPVLIPDQVIYRNDASGEYNITIDAATIRLASERFSKLGFHKQSNLEHTLPLDKTYIVESWIVEEGQDKSQNLGFNLPAGTWMVSMKIENEAVWAKAKAGEIKGFSIEGFFDHIRIQELAAAKPQKTPKTTMLKNFTGFARFLFGRDVKLSDQTLASGETIVINDETKEVRYLNEDGTLGDPLADGSYELQNGETINVKDGYVTEAPAEEPAKEVEAAEEDPAPQEDGSAARIAALEEKVAALAEKVQSMLNGQTEVSTELQKMSKAVTQLAANPAVPVSKATDKNTSALSPGAREKNFLMNL